MNRNLKDVAASVRQRLYNIAKKAGRPFSELLQYYAIERFLFRLSQSKYKDRLILKGALMFVAWNAPHSRATRDIDLLAGGSNSVENIRSIVKELCQIEVTPDGMTFNQSSVKGEIIKKNEDYKGVRIRFEGRLGQAKVFMQIDFGFGDYIFPEPITISYPSILDMPSLQLKGYPPETVVAEKFHAMVDRGILNSRMKDYYDIWLISNQFNFSGKTLGKSLIETFKKRDTQLIAKPVGLSESFAFDKSKMVQWKAFIRKSNLDHHMPHELDKVIASLRKFLIPITEAAINHKYDNLIWKVPGPWKK